MFKEKFLLENHITEKYIVYFVSIFTICHNWSQWIQQSLQHIRMYLQFIDLWVIVMKTNWLAIVAYEPIVAYKTFIIWSAIFPFNLSSTLFWASVNQGPIIYYHWGNIIIWFHESLRRPANTSWPILAQISVVLHEQTFESCPNISRNSIKNNYDVCLWL